MPLNNSPLKPIENNRLCVFITGLPACGKSTLGRYLASLLSINLLDKDDYLEQLFDAQGVGDSQWRQRLSREADLLFKNAAQLQGSVILVSHWRPPTIAVNYGTPCDWIINTFDQVIEIFCDCTTNIAAQRFVKRVRHVGHVDEAKSHSEVVQWLNEYNKQLPIGIGSLITVNTQTNDWQESLKNQLEGLL